MQKYSTLSWRRSCDLCMHLEWKTFASTSKDSSLGFYLTVSNQHSNVTVTSSFLNEPIPISYTLILNWTCWDIPWDDARSNLCVWNHIRGFRKDDKIYRDQLLLVNVILEVSLVKGIQYVLSPPLIEFTYLFTLLLSDFLLAIFMEHWLFLKKCNKAFLFAVTPWGEEFK